MKHVPLAHRIRPTKIEEVIGQKHLLGDNKPLFRMIKNNQLSSMILFGPPGIGKTTIASAIAGSSNLPFHKLNAVQAGKKDLEKIAKECENSEDSILLYVDEVHRFTKTQVEFLLPFMESGDIIVISSTTESVYHSLPGGILSRSTVFELKPLTSDEMVIGLKRALDNKENGLGEYNVSFSDECLTHLAETCGGDMRSALNALEILVVSNSTKNSENAIEITMEMIEEATNKKNLGYNGDDSKYDLLSAFQKSIRGSDVNASLYYLGLLLESGDLQSIGRRLLVIADEDIGLGNVHASTHALTAVQIAERVGLPEARIPLSKIVVELCLSPKSNSTYSALDLAISDIRNGKVYPIPSAIRDTHYEGAKHRGHGTSYLYPHNYQVGGYGGWVPQNYMPIELNNKVYYSPKEIGDEKQYAQIYKKLEEIKNKK